jgi:hypothetical protein
VSWPSSSPNVLLDPNPFYLPAMYGRHVAYAEAAELCDHVKRYGADGRWNVGSGDVSSQSNGMPDQAVTVVSVGASRRPSARRHSQ